MHELDASFEPVRAVWRTMQLPGIEEGLSWGTPGLKVRNKMMLRIREPDVLVILCDFAEKEHLLQSNPDVYFQTDHYKGYPAILAQISRIEPDELAYHIEKLWRSLASKKMLAEYEAGQVRD